LLISNITLCIILAYNGGKRSVVSKGTTKDTALRGFDGAKPSNKITDISFYDKTKKNNNNILFSCSLCVYFLLGVRCSVRVFLCLDVV